MSAPVYDVVVVGGRIAGASTALLLARAGARVGLIERGARGSDTVSTHGLMRAGVLQLSRWGILETVVAAGTPPIHETVFHYAGGDPVKVSIRPSPGVDALYAPRRYLLDRILVDAAAAAGADVLHGLTVTELLRDPGTPSRVAGVRALSRGGAGIDVRGRYTVGADGIGSVVAAQTGSDVVHAGATATAVLYRYLAELPTAGYEWAYGEGAAAGLLPTNDGLVCAFVGATPDRMRALRRHGTAGAFEALLRQAGPGIADRVSAARNTGRDHGWAGRAGFVRRSTGPGWALVGDAGYYKDPITTHGMTDALRDAELLATALLDTLVGGVPEARALGRYQATRDRLSRRLFDVTEEVAGFDWDMVRIQSLLRQVSSAMSEEVDYLQALPPSCQDEPLTRPTSRQ